MLAIEEYPDHPIKKCLSENPELFSDMQIVKHIRNSFSHGSFDGYDVDLTLISKQKTNIKKFLSSFNITRNIDSNKNDEVESSDDIYNIILKAELNIANKLSSDTTMRIKGSKLYENLIVLEQGLVKGSPSINTMYNALDWALFESFKPDDFPEGGQDAEVIKREMIDKFKLPLSFNIKTKFLEQTMQGLHRSLGASCISYLWLFQDTLDHEDLQKLINLVGTLLDARGRGDGQTQLDTQKLNSLSDRLYSQIKKILG